MEKTGGASTVTLTTAQIPNHTHRVSGSTNETGRHSHYEHDSLWANQPATTGSSAQHQVSCSGGVWLTCRTQGGGMRAKLSTNLDGLHSHTFFMYFWEFRKWKFTYQFTTIHHLLYVETNQVK